MSGNKVMGKVNKEINPNKRMMIDTTVDNTGLSINLLIIRIILCSYGGVNDDAAPLI